MTLILFSRSQEHFEMFDFDQNSALVLFLLNGMMDSGQTLYMS